MGYESFEHPFQFKDPGGRTVAAVLSQPEAQTDQAVVLCHGFLSTKNSSSNRALTRRLISREVATLRFDWFGMGESEGAFADLTVGACLEQVRGAIQFVRDRGYTRVGLIGSSFGGLVALLGASQDLALAAVGLKCPVPDFPEMLRLEFGESGMARWEERDEIPDVTGGSKPLHLRYAFYQDCRQHDAYRAAAAIRCPVLIVHGERDEHVPLRQIHRLHESLACPKRLELLPEADHGFSRREDFERMVGSLGEWMETHLRQSTGPSDAGASPCR